jgi:4-hydroxy-tetrahydrodipicolinate synthase
MFEGFTVAMVTPFREGRVDWDAADRLLDHLLRGGVDGVVPAGSTGEGATITLEERRQLFRLTRRRCGTKAFVLAGTGTNDTASTIALTQAAKDDGADGALVVTPYYNKPTPAGLMAHFRRVAEEGGLPLCLYNVPGRTGVSLTPETARRLSEIPGIVALKEASASLDQVSEICRNTTLTVLSGDDTLTLPMLAVGARGVISVVGNVVPAPMNTMIRAFEKGDTAEARRLHQALFPLGRVLFVESNPGPVKHALARMGLICEELRLPLVPVTPESARNIDAVLESLPPEWGTHEGATR